MSAAKSQGLIEKELLYFPCGLWRLQLQSQDGLFQPPHLEETQALSLNPLVLFHKGQFIFHFFVFCLYGIEVSLLRKIQVGFVKSYHLCHP